MGKILTILACMVGLTSFGQPIQRNAATTNSQSALITFIQSLCGTVTSVGLSFSGATVGGSPVIGAGTLTISLSSAQIQALIGAGVYDASGAALNATNGVTTKHVTDWLAQTYQPTNAAIVVSNDTRGLAFNSANSMVTFGGATAASITNSGLTGQGIIGSDANGKLVAGSLSAATIASDIGTGGLPIADVNGNGTILTNYHSLAVTLTNTVNLFVGAFFSPTNGVPYTWSLASGSAYATNINASITLAGFSGIPATLLWGVYLLVTNSSASTYTVTFPGGCKANASLGYAVPPVFYITNGTSAEFQINGWGTIGTTNVNWSPH